MAWITIDGNEAVARVAYALSEALAIYPITPASPMGEHADAWAAQGRPNLWGAVPRVVEMQSEAGAAGVVHGLAQGGALAATFTASQGLLLMVPEMFKLAGELNPCVFHVATRALAVQALSIFCSHDDLMAVRHTVPSMVFEPPTRWPASRPWRRPSSRPWWIGGRWMPSGPAPSPRSTRSCVAAARIPTSISRGGNGSIRCTPPFLAPWRGAWRASRRSPGGVIDRSSTTVTPMPSACWCSWVLGSIRRWRRPRPSMKGEGGWACCRCVCSVPGAERRWCAPWGADGEPLFKDVALALARHGGARFATPPCVVGARYGLGSKEFTPGMVKQAFDELARAQPRDGLAIGVWDDLTDHGLPGDPAWRNPRAHEDVHQAVFYGLGSDGTVSANRAAIRLIGDILGCPVQGYFVYDSKKSGAMTVSHLRVSPRPIRSRYLIGDGEADFVACHQARFLERLDFLRSCAMPPPGPRCW